MSKGEKWLVRFGQSVNDHVAEGSLKNRMLAAQAGLSERHLIRRVKHLPGLSPKSTSDATGCNWHNPS